MQLFAIMMGGDIAGAQLELHDVRFVAADRIEDTYDRLRQGWWGRPASLHLDCWAALAGADGYTITLNPEPYSGTERLFFVHLGGYDGTFQELHANLFVVAPDKDAAKKRALALAPRWADRHRDTLYDVDSVIALADHMGPLHIHLAPGGPAGQPAFICQYKKIGQAA